MVELKFRNFVTILVMGCLIGGVGIVISYDGLANSSIVISEITAPDGTFTKTFKDNSLASSQYFGIYLGAILGFGSGIIALLYKSKSAGGEDT